MEDTPMNDAAVDELGPVDYLVVEFPADKADFSGAMAAELSALVGRGVVRVLDVLILKKDLDGSVEGFETHDFGDSDLAELLQLETELALLLAAEDVEAIGAAIGARIGAMIGGTGARIAGTDGRGILHVMGHGGCGGGRDLETAA